MNRLKSLREAKGMKQSELGKLLNVQDAAISKYESGKVPLTGETLLKLSKIFNVSTDYLLGNSDYDDDIPSVESPLGKQLKILRELKGKSQQEVCSALNIEQSSLANYESGRRIPKIDILIKLAEYYNISVDCLLGLEKMNAENNCDNYFYEEGMANWNIRTKSEELGISYEDALRRTDIKKERFDLLWFGNSQPYAEELVRFSTVLGVSVDYLLDISKKEKMTSEEAMVLNYYQQYPNEVLDLLGSFCSLTRKQRAIVTGKCFELEASSVAADEPMRKASGK